MNKIKRVGEKKSERPIKEGDIFTWEYGESDDYFILTRADEYTLYDLKNGGKSGVSFNHLINMVDYIADSDLIRLEQGEKIEIEVG